MSKFVDGNGVVINLVNDVIAFNEGKIVLTNKVFNKMLSYANYTKSEISGFGKIKEEGDNVIVTDIKIFPQVCTGAHTELKQEDLITFIGNVIAHNGNSDDWKLWWHSHYDFDVFFSTVDTDTIAELTRGSEMFPGGSRLYSICINNIGQMAARKDENGLFVADLDIVITPDYRSKIYKAVKSEVDKKVSKRIYVNTIIEPMQEVVNGRFTTATIKE